MAVRGRPTLTGPESIFNNKDRREASTTELLAMGSTCSTLDGVDAPAFPDEAYSVVAPMRDAQAPDTCLTSNGATTRLAACFYLC